MMCRFLAITTVIVVGCGDTIPVTPDGTSTTGAGGSSPTTTATSASASSSSGEGGSGAGPSSGYGNSGSRLKLVTFAGADGSNHVSDGIYFDTSTGKQCSVGRAADGQLRCLPSSNNAYITVYYGNNTCTNPVGYTSKNSCQMQPDFAVQSIAMGCVYGNQLRPVNGPLNGTIYLKGTGTCTAMDPVTLSTYNFYALGPEVNYASFVAFTESHE
jgi:hypothetical protein